MTLTVSMRASDSIEVDLPIRIHSEMNSRDHWRVVRKRAKEHHQAVFYTLVPFRNLLKLIADSGERIVVTFTRLGPGRLDSDNLESGFKFVRDEVAKMLDFDDRHDRYVWNYQQEYSRTYSARVKVEAGGARP